MQSGKIATVKDVVTGRFYGGLYEKVRALSLCCISSV